MLLIFFGMTESLNAEEAPPNVVLIFADVPDFGDLSCYNASKVKRPTLISLLRKVGGL